MKKDPVVEEVRAVRAGMLKQAGGTLDGLTAMLRQKRTLRPGIKMPRAPGKPQEPSADRNEGDAR